MVRCTQVSVQGVVHAEQEVWVMQTVGGGSHLLGLAHVRSCAQELFMQSGYCELSALAGRAWLSIKATGKVHVFGCSPLSVSHHWDGLEHTGRLTGIEMGVKEILGEEMKIAMEVYCTRKKT